jgi:predicted Co/Zn/Cd cation transporter (cation efflux family)
MFQKNSAHAETKAEQGVLWLSFYAGLLFAVIEFIFSIFSNSQSALMDAVYDASELVFIAFTLFLTPLFHKPISEKYPYGFFQVESIVLIIKGVMMLSVTVGLSADIIGKALSGGNHVNARQVALFQAALGTLSVLIYLVMKQRNRTLSSPTVDAELLDWKLDIVYSYGMSLAFFGSSFLSQTPLDFLVPYFDPLMAVIVVVLMLPENLKMLWTAIKDVFLFSPDPEMLEEVKTAATQVLTPYHFSPAFFDVIRTGRFLWISVYFTIPGGTLQVADLRTASETLNRHLSGQFENCSCELILTPEGTPPQRRSAHPIAPRAETQAQEPSGKKAD